jgi:amino acid adenylation domain-containing protein
MVQITRSSQFTDSIAIVGIGCSFPGGVESPNSLWRFLGQGGDAIVEVPADRWNVDAVHDPLPGTPGKTASRRAGLLQDVASFDAGFFGISPREAAVMDPQQRLLLEVTWRALEDAGIPAESLAGSSTGVYIGVSHSDYHGIQQFGRRQIDVHAATGGALSIVANRLSHRLDLRGPSLAIDTACSSSLVALDAGCNALLSGDCDTTLVGGVNVMLTPDVTITFSRASMLSPDGRCKAFDARANGYVRGEGAGIVILKLLSRALLDRDRIHAVIRATAVNQDGQTSTITVPSRDAQVDMLRQACARANVHPSQIGYVEAHGTGTAVGDPIEANAIGTVFGEGRTADSACVIGSIKTNIGHLEPAAGIAGLIKAVLCVREGEIPPSLHFERPNPHIDFDRLGIRVQGRLGPWPIWCRPRIAAVNSFGFGGTNACAIVEQPPQPTRPSLDRDLANWWPTLVPVSAASKTALTTVCAQLSETLHACPHAFLDAVGTLALRRSHLDHRLVLPAKSVEEALSALRAVAAGETPGTAISGRKSSDRRLAFVFTGQGAQWWGMGRGLLQQDPLFRAVVERCDQLFSQRSGWSLLEQLTRSEEDSRIHETFVAQPAIFALQVALAERLAAWGIRPGAVVGHSIGEIAAAHVAGALSLPQAVDVVYHRSRLQERARRQGGMAAVGLAADRVRSYLEKFDGELEVAAINGPELVSIAGPRALLDRFIEDVGREQTDVLCQILRVDYAFHSRQMDPFTGELRDSLRGLRSNAVTTPMFSSVTGEAIHDDELDADYWCRNMREPVLFKRAIDRAIDAGFDTFLELGPHPSLITPTRACLAESNRDGLAMGTLHRERPDTESIVSAVASLHVHGLPIDWAAIVPRRWKFVELPGHPWDKQVHWAESEESRAARLDGPVHPLLGYRLKSLEPIWQSEIDANAPRYLQDHRIDGAVVFPAAGYVELMFAAAYDALGEGRVEIEAISFHEALFLSAETPTLIETSFDQARGIVRIHSRQRGAGPNWVLRATGRVRRWDVPEFPIKPWTPKIEPPTQVGHARFYRDLAEEGHAYGSAFQGVDSIWYAEGCALGKVVLPASITDADRYVLHPAVLDACLQVTRGLRAFGDDARSGAEVTIPFAIDRLRLFRKPSDTIFARSYVLEDSATEIVTRMSIVDDTGRLVATIDGLRCMRVAGSDKQQQHAATGFYRERWVALPARAEAMPAEPSDLVGFWLILADRGGTGEALAKSITRRGGRAALVFQARRDARISEDRYEVAPSAASLSRTLAALDRQPTHVIHLWTLDEGEPQPTAAGLVRARRVGIEGMAALCRALAGQQPKSQQIKSQPAKPRLWVVTAGTAEQASTSNLEGSFFHAAMTGFLRTLANEHPDYRPTLLDVDLAAVSTDALLDEIAMDTGETEVALRSGERFGARLEPVAENSWPPRRRRWDAKSRMPAFRVGMNAPGAIANLALLRIDRPEPQAGQVVIEVHAVGLNFRDVMAATGLLPADAEEAPAWQRLGFECAGVVSAAGEGVDPNWIGRRVVAVTPGCMASHVAVSTDRIFSIPRRMSFASAAAIPVAFATAHHALVTRARLKPGERVLIHAAAGGVGLAAISIAQALGAEILATAGSQEKRRHLYRLGVEHVFDSRSLAFAGDVSWTTGGRGVDVVLNSLQGPFLEKSLSVLASGGRFLEIGKRDIYADTALGLHAMRNNAAFYAIDLAKLAADRPDLLRAEIEAVLSKLGRGRLQMMPVTTLPVSEVAAAFRRMSEVGHIGKIVVSFDDDKALVQEQPSADLPIAPDAAYLVTGGMGGFGLETARWLVDNGARSLVLVARSSKPTPEVEERLNDLRSAGAVVTLVSADVGTRAGVRAALAAVERGGKPLRGIVHAAGTIDDAFIEKLTPDQIHRVFTGKVLGAWYLNELTRSARLDFFVLYSSVAATLGSLGQAHYAAANRMLDAIAAFRRSDGLPATSIAFGPVGDSGYLTRRQDVARYMSGVGMQVLPTAAALAVLGIALRHAPMDMAFAQINWSKLAQAFALVGSSPRTSSLAQTSLVGGSGSDQHVRSSILAARDQQRQGIISEYLHRQVAMVLKVEPTTIEPGRPLHELGLDSLTAFELKNRIESELGVALPVSRFLQRPTISTIAGAIVEAINTDTGASTTAEVDGGGLNMSVGQEALWFINRFDPGNPAYGLAACLAFRPHVNEEHLDKTVQSLILRHENLRFAFPSDGIGPVPTLMPLELYRLRRHDAVALTETDFSAALQAEANKPFDVEEGPLGRLHLFRRADRDVILLQFHHIVADAASIAILLDEMIEAYYALQAGLPLSNRRQTHFGQFVAWQQALVAGTQGEAHRSYWRQQLAGAPSSLPLATDHPRPLTLLGPGAARNFTVKGPIVEELKGLARTEATTLFSVLLAAFNVLMHRYSGSSDIVVGTPMNGRTRPEFERVVGYLVNALPIRTRVSGEDSFQQLVARVDATVRSSLEHQDYPFPMIVRDVAPVREPGSPPIFQVMFGMERFDSADPRGLVATLLNVAGLALQYREYTVESVGIARNRAPLDMTFTMEESGNQIFGVVDYRCDLWDDRTIAQLIGDYQAILHQIVAAPAREIADFKLGPDDAKPICGRALGDAPDVLASLNTIAAARPDAIAVSDASGELSYRDLLRRVDMLAAAMVQRGVGRGAAVGICLPRTRDLPAAMLAALATGAAYVPLDPTYPEQRLAGIVADAKPSVVIADRQTAARLPSSAPFLFIDAADGAPGAFAAGAVVPDDLAYIIHTSGSTGRPLGVEIERGALANFLAAMQAELRLSPDGALLAVTPYSFDIAALELLLPLTIGARVVIADEVCAHDGRLLSSRIDRGDITIMQATPATWQMLVDAGWMGSNRLIALCGGEALPAALAVKVRPRVASLWNLYGPTETTIWSMAARIDEVAEMIPIGRPIANTSCLIVDEMLRPVGPGIAGELLIGGAGLARGYHNDSLRTAERFIPDPLDPESGRRVFRTGDFVRAGSDGTLQFLGRRDQQVKIRGFRIELGEVEATLRSHASVRDAAVLATGDDLHNRRLVAFVERDSKVDAEGLTGYLRNRLPYYMVPDIIRTVGAIPRLPNGKTDRRRLAVDAQLPDAHAPETERPRTPIEAQLVAILEELLEHNRIGLDDNFFSLGGTSLLGIRYVTRISGIYNVRLGVAALMRAPTVAAMAQLVVDQLKDGGTTGKPHGINLPLDVPIGQKLWRPLAMIRAEGSFDEIDAAAIAYLPDELLDAARRIGTEQAVRRRLPRANDPQWGAVCHLPFGTIALVVVPRFGIDLIADPDAALNAVQAAADYASRLGARTAALTGLIPAVTDLGRALRPREGLEMTTGHATTASAIVLTTISAAQAAARNLVDETVAFVGLGAIGTATLRLMLDRTTHPRRLVLCDVPAKSSHLVQLAHEIRTNFGYCGNIEIAAAPGAVPDEVYQSRFIIGATNVPGVLEIERLAPGTIVIDDSFPHCFDLDKAIDRTRSRGDILPLDGGLVSPRGLIEWTMTMPANFSAVLGHHEAGLLPDSTAITGCILSSLLAQSHDAPATTGPVSITACRDHWQALHRLGIGAAPLRCGRWSPSDAYLNDFRKFAATSRRGRDHDVP